MAPRPSLIKLAPHRRAAPVDTAASLTFAGMAHFARPDQPETCGDCRFWASTGTGSAGWCDKVVEFTGRRAKTPVPKTAASCRYYEGKAETPRLSTGEAA